LANGIARGLEFIGCAWSLSRDTQSFLSILWAETKNIRVAGGAAAYHPQEVYTLKTKIGHLHFRDNFGDVTNLADVIWRDVYRVMKNKPKGTMLDVGANVGLAAAMLSYVNPSGRIICIEPLAACCRMVQNNCPNAEVVQAAAGAEPGTVRLRVDPDQVIASAIPTAWSAHDEDVPVRTLDEICADKGITDVGFLKMDVEGMEGEVFDGAEQTLRRTKRIAMETHGKALHEQIQQRLRDAGFTITASLFKTKTGMVYAERR
jgi:FkbM family methyltransferase